MARQCGYCRQYNHTKRNCNKLASEVEYIRKYIPAETMNIHNALLEKGWGIGAMVEVTDWAGNTHVCIIDDLSGIFSTHSFTDYRNVKYSKQVKTFLKNMTGKYVAGTPENVSFHQRHELNFQVFNPANPSSRTYATVTRGMLGLSADPNFMWCQPSVLLSPSHDTNASYSDFLNMDIRLHDRLILSGQDAYVKGLAI